MVVQGGLGCGFLVCWGRQGWCGITFVLFIACNIGGNAVWEGEGAFWSNCGVWNLVFNIWVGERYCRLYLKSMGMWRRCVGCFGMVNLVHGWLNLDGW